MKNYIAIFLFLSIVLGASAQEKRKIIEADNEVLSSWLTPEYWDSYKYTDTSRRVPPYEITYDQTKGLPCTWSFELNHDTSAVRYTVGNFRINDRRIILPNWTINFLWDINTKEVGDSSFTEVFSIKTDDVIKFTRDLIWVQVELAPTYKVIGPWAKFTLLDKVAFVVELVDADTKQRVAVLDSALLKPSPVNSFPQYFSSNLPIVYTKYTVPANLNNKNVFMRVKLYQVGLGEFWINRLDDLVSDDPNEQVPAIMRTLMCRQVGVGCNSANKIEPKSLINANKPNTILKVGNVVSNRAEVTYSPAADGAETSIILYDESGQALQYVSNIPNSSNVEKTQINFPSGRTFFVCLHHNGGLVKTEKVIIDK